jgi:antitoxin VapB
VVACEPGLDRILGNDDRAAGATQLVAERWNQGYISTMPLNIKNPTTERLAHELAALTGESLTEAVTAALRDRLAALSQRGAAPALHAEIAELQRFVRKHRTRDRRSAEEILGYDANGLPT